MDLSFIPISKKEIDALGWDYIDVILISGDAYIDHPSFGTAVIARVLENIGYRVAIIPQPNWQDDLRDFKKLGRPRLFFGVTAGNMDSMINRYTANKRMRSDDAYTPGGRSGARPDYASIVYTTILKKLYPDVPVVLGGIEASMRRFTHYDYWSDSVMKPILFDSKADILVYGMGEQPITDIINYAMTYGSEALLQNSVYHSLLSEINQIGYINDSLDNVDVDSYIMLNSHKTAVNDKRAFADNFMKIEQESNKYCAKGIIEQVDDKYMIVNKHNPPMTTDQLDAIYDLPFTRLPHPKYSKKDIIPAYNMIHNSVNIHRGCFGGCSFCTISAHQGKFIVSRSEKSILNEVQKVSSMPDFGGTISDLGGPSANMYMMKGVDFELCKKCTRHSCMYPVICNNLNFDHTPLLKLYKEVEKIPNVKNIFIGSGIRYDLFFPKDQSKAEKYNVLQYAETVIAKHTGGRLKVAPEHCSDNVLKLMRKPSFSTFYQFKSFFDKICKTHNYPWQLIPYFISSHPGCEVSDMAQLATETKKIDYKPEQVQTFTPTPMTLSTTMFYSGINPFTQEKVFSARKIDDKKIQNLFLFWYLPENRRQIEEILRKTGNTHYIEELYGETRAGSGKRLKNKH